MAVYAIGDIQGCLEPLRRLLERIRYDPAADRLWFTGDLVNRGPQSLETLRFVRALGAGAASVLGNHDLHLVAVAAGNGRPQDNDTLRPILDAADGPELLDWLRRRPLLHEAAEAPGYALVHAGVPPQWDLPTARALARELETALRGTNWRAFLREMYGDRPSRWDASLHGSERLRFATNAFTRMRYCAADGPLLLEFKGAPADAPADHYPWFEAPGRRDLGTTLVFGHWSSLGYRRTPDVLGLDTGCLWGGALTAARLGAREEIVSLPCDTARAE